MRPTRRLARDSATGAPASGLSGWAALSVLAVLLAGAPADAAPPSIYHSPADDGASGGIPSQVPAGSAVTLHLYLGIGPSASTADPCLQGDGDEGCGYQVRLGGSGLTLQSFTPDDPDVLFRLSAGTLELIGGDFQNGELGPTRLGDLVVESSGPGGALELLRGEFVNAQLAKEEITPQTIVTLPEPGALGLLAGSLLLVSLRRAGRRRRRLLGLVATASALALPCTAQAVDVVFGTEQAIDVSASGVREVFAADLDGDGDLDVLAAIVIDDTIAWYENTDGRGSFGPERPIATNAEGATSVFAADVDGDGDLDALSATQGDDTIAWYENTDGRGSFGSARPVFASANTPQSVFAADVDGDGDVDVLSASVGDDTIAWYENTDGHGSFGPEKTITTGADGARSVFAADLDRDGDLDVMSASFNDDTIAWYENLDGQGSFSAAQVISSSADGARSVFAADVDGDGDVDVLSASFFDDKIAWYPNHGGSFGTSTISYLEDGARSVSAADVDGDGDVDVLSASENDDTIAWFENIDGQGTFGPSQTKTITSTADGAHGVVAADVDGDGDLDVLSASQNDATVAWYENQTIHRSGEWTRAGTITREADAGSIFAADVDGDGDLDVLSASRGKDEIAWYENGDGLGSFGKEPAFTTPATDPTAVFAADLDGDGDLDALSASVDQDAIAWYPNTDGLGTFGPVRTITTLADGVVSIFAADLDGDGDLDALSASKNDDTVAWYENLDGQGSFGAGQTITTSASGARAVFAADVDGDGDLDVVAAASASSTIFWYPNTDGKGSFGPSQVVTTVADDPVSIFVADVDGDGDLDVLSADLADDTVDWYPNSNGLGSFGPGQTITTISFPTSVSAVDLDGDGDLDVLVQSAGEDMLAWCANNGLGSFGPRQVFGRYADGGGVALAADVDGDGDLDVLSTSAFNKTIDWYENSDGRGRFVPEPIWWYEAAGADAVSAADLDGDGDLDALSMSLNYGVFAWHENADGAGRFKYDTISSGAPMPRGVAAADMDGDGDLDALAVPSLGTLVWYENSDGQGSFESTHTITSSAAPVTSLVAGDVDEDGDLDVVLACQYMTAGGIGWYENSDGQGTVWTAHLGSVSSDPAISITAVDMDGDGDLDVVSADSVYARVRWHENDGQGSFGPWHPVTTAADGVGNIFAADLDGDGDPDVLVASQSDDPITWYENGGQGTFGPAQAITTIADVALSVLAVDVDRDGDLDVLSTSYGPDTVAWYENTDGLGSFGPEQTLTTTATEASLSMGDVDGDGDPDALAATGNRVGLTWYANRSGQASFHTRSTHPDWVGLLGGQVELLQVDLTHRGRAGDADVELASLALQLDTPPGAPIGPDPVRLLTSAEANALFDSLLVYRDDGSGAWESGSDMLVAMVPTLSLTDGIQMLTLPDAEPDVRVAAGETGRFFVVGKLTATSGLGRRQLRVRHVSPRSEVHHAATDIVLSQAPGSGGQPRTLLFLDPAGDEDGDGLANAIEIMAGADPFDTDTDDDGLSDADEVNVYGTDPVEADSDGDGLSDPDELNVHGTDPTLADSDGDGLVDGDEIAAGTDPFVVDSDGDGLSDGAEAHLYGTDPLVPGGDSDGDGIPDFDEIARGMHPGLTDTDADGVGDAVDNCPSAFNPLQEDTGGFGVSTPDGVGDLCQNGDFNRDGQVDVLDVTLKRRGLIGLEPTLDPALPPSTP